jgi:hypothetical protein
MRKLLKIPGAEHAAVIGEGEAWHFKVNCSSDEILNAIRAIEQ